ncbi:hypothetical protein F4825DRAFT_118402 [Nemania diffusa]|nr:hypothetical protein F4825DRAFT_118402 [Nemania diffusa]
MPQARHLPPPSSRIPSENTHSTQFSTLATQPPSPIFDMSLSFWSTSIDEAPTSSPAGKPSVVLDFFAALHVDQLKVYHPSELQYQHSQIPVAGRGRFGSIEVSKTRVLENNKFSKRLVAVKQSRLPSQIPTDHRSGDEIVKNLNQLTLELRILGLKAVQNHPNLVTILGICMDDLGGAPLLAIVMEYSELGSLKSFLVTRDHDLSAQDHLKLIAQAANGLGALHDLGICHGDVKTQNALVFAGDGLQEWVVKLADFGQSAIAPHGSPSAQIECPLGTRLLNAPELRGQYNVYRPQQFTIQTALLTDVFSFGLLAWEIFKCGHPYFENSWFPSFTGETQGDGIEGFLNKLPPDQLLQLSLNFISTLRLDDVLHTLLSHVLKCCLRDIPEHRKPIALVVDSLRSFLENKTDDYESSTASSDFDLEDFFGGSLSSWTTSHSLFNLRDYALMTGKDILDDIPRSLRSQIVSELMSLSRNEHISDDIRAHAAMMVSECLSVGFSGVHDNNQMLFWLRQAASLGYRKAELWYHRICDALGEDADKEILIAEGMDLDSSADPPESILIKRIHHHNNFIRERARQSLPLPGSDLLSAQNMKSSVCLFNDDTIDEINLIHLAAWFGANELLTKLLMVGSADMTSTLGFNALHYACLGGNLSTLRILLSAGIPVLAADFHDITPAHFAIFFCSSDVVEAIALLVQHGAQVKSPSRGLLKWEMHGLVLTGTVLRWAIDTRNRPLVRTLLPSFTPIGGEYLHSAMVRFFWEILEDLLPHFLRQGEELHDLTRLQTISNPYEHWIAHGLGSREAIRRTVRLWNEHDLIGFNEDGSSHLHTIISTILAMDDFCLAQEVISVSSDSYVRHRQPSLYSSPPLGVALQSCGNNFSWRDTIDALASRYTVEELENSDGKLNSFMGDAVSHDSVIGAQILIEKGVNVNTSISYLTPMTPLHDCISREGSPAMMSLLIEFGADVLAQETTLGLSPLEWIILGRSQWALLDLLLKHEYAEAVYVQALRISLHACFQQFQYPQTYRMDMVNTFRYLLTRERFNKYVNSPDEVGLTLIQEAASWLHADSVRLLLEAQADASIPFNGGNQKILPLQIACAQARVLGIVETGSPSRFDSVSAERKAAAIKVTSELLDWHTARGDDTFRGITKLHLACRMGMVEQVSGLLQSGDSRRARGVWPGISREVVPEDLLPPLDEDIFIRDENLPIRNILESKQDFLPLTQATAQSVIDLIRDQSRDSPVSDLSEFESLILEESTTQDESD